MGDRVSISFVNGNDESIALFHHWGGRAFAGLAKEYAKELKAEMAKKDPKRGTAPLDRLEPSIVMVDFVVWYGRHYVKTGRVESSLYFGKDENDGDNSDNGHYRIRLDTSELQDTLDEASEED